MIRLLLTDDHQVLLDGVKALIGQEGDMQVVGEALNGQEALDRLKELEVDVVLLDVNMPVMDGLAACDAIEKQHPSTKVIAMSMYGEGRMVQAMLNKGAKGYLLKSCGREELLEAIRTVNAGGTWLSRPAMDDLVKVMHEPIKPISAGIETLTDRELEVLRLIADELTTTDIADRLKITVNTVESHRRNLLSKLGVRNSAGLVRKALAQGLIDR